ncbi:MAG: phosphoribosylaminoimidazolesuccinocarboxamide synthase [Candidatus Cloacimonetes bacterium]|nr:phosphoribosylaminoimidazolesuccinocarboxamide synthase [Candidatus Cloacimonadota bacterium]
MTESIGNLPLVKKHFQGKVRDIYDLGDTLLIVTSDRISAFDVVFPTIIPNKGKILTQISIFFFKMTEQIVKNHFITDKIEEFPPELHPYKEELIDRSMLVKKTRVIPFECIVRGYISGSAWSEYKKQSTVGGMILPEGVNESQKFENPLFTPSTKAEVGNDVNISYQDMMMMTDKKIAEFLKSISLELYQTGHKYLFEKDIILADTKFEYGTLKNEIILIDEILTPDSSRFWDKNEYSVGYSPKSYDKQYIRDYIVNAGWDKKPPAPELPKEVVEKTYEKYYQAYKTIVGTEAKVW